MVAADPHRDIIERIEAWEPEHSEDPWIDIAIFAQSLLTEEQVKDAHVMAGALSAVVVQIVAGDPEYAATIARQFIHHLDPDIPLSFAEEFAAAYRGRYEERPAS